MRWRTKKMKSIILVKGISVGNGGLFSLGILIGIQTSEKFPDEERGSHIYWLLISLFQSCSQGF